MCTTGYRPASRTVVLAAWTSPASATACRARTSRGAAWAGRRRAVDGTDLDERKGGEEPILHPVTRLAPGTDSALECTASGPVD